MSTEFASTRTRFPSPRSISIRPVFFDTDRAERGGSSGTLCCAAVGHGAAKWIGTKPGSAGSPKQMGRGGEMDEIGAKLAELLLYPRDNASYLATATRRGAGTAIRGFAPMNLLTMTQPLRDRRWFGFDTDGYCLNTPGPGGWGAVLEHPSSGRTKTLSGGTRQSTTNNHMELQALIKALGALKQPCQIQLYTDSKYLIGGMNGQKRQINRVKYFRSIKRGTAIRRRFSTIRRRSRPVIAPSVATCSKTSSTL